MTLEAIRSATLSSGPASMTAWSFSCLVGQEGTAWAATPSNRAQWLKLYASCSWSTAFQHPDFFDVWCRHYDRWWSPLLVVSYDEVGTLRGIMPLACNADSVTGVGAHQAEYHGWLSTEA